MELCEKTQNTKRHALVKNINLEIIASGFLFFFLLPERFLITFLERSFPYPKKKKKGVGDWKKEPVLTLFLNFYYDVTIIFYSSCQNTT
jgi:hypothetical protein